ncbi:MAG: 30S ribosomal protein S12 methylthiotransferase RimO [Gemmatimonadales bacterium]|nr:MAG: 30S ribosomal protein S12 methylthiotransferase RimO [Gemmatimonadales bacterium]
MRSRDLPVFPVAPEPVRPGVPFTVREARRLRTELGPEQGPRISLVTLGCDKNTVDSERMMASLVGHGARVTSEVEDSEVVIVNTCGFIEAAKEQSIETILEACSLKEDGRVRAVVAVGCMVQRYKDELAREIPEVDLYMGLTELQGLVPELQDRGLLPPPDRIPIMERPLRLLTGDLPHTSFLKISEGCDHTCAFCAIPLMRGLHRSQPLEELVEEARSLGKAGVRELNIVSQDTTWWGRDLRRRDRSAPLLPDLLRALLDRTEVDWYRLFYMYPSGITRELVELMAERSAEGEGARLLPYLDMPLQHGSDRMLQAMRRPERRDTIRERVAWLRDALPDLTLRTTVIVGFPGETEEDFGQLLELLEEIRFERVGAFAFSVEEGTRAAEMPDHLPDSLKRERLERLMDLQRGISLERNLEQVGAVQTVLVDRIVEPEEDEDFGAVGRTQGQATDVDGVTHLLRGPVVGPGDMTRVEIVDAMEYDLIGRVLGP